MSQPRSQQPTQASRLSLALMRAGTPALIASSVIGLGGALTAQAVILATFGDSAASAWEVQHNAQIASDAPATAGAVAPATAPAAPAIALAANAPVTLLDLERGLFDRVNADRMAHGLAPVADDPALPEVARARAAAQIPP